MKLSVSSVCKQVQNLVNFQGSQVLNLDSFYRRKDKVVFVMGATGTGKSRLAIDLAIRFRAEIVNCDKIQLYKGLDIVTNKVTDEECRGVHHHLLGIADPDSNFTAADFQKHASVAVDSIIRKDRHPIIAGGSNSYIEALYGDPDFQVRHECCFLWVDVSLPVLHSFVSERVDRMVQLGLVDEVRQIFDPEADYSRGIRRAIGVPELDQYLRAEGIVDERTRVKYLEAAIDKIKRNTCELARRQLKNIHRLYDKWNWRMHRIDATEVFRKRGHHDADEAWEKLVARPSNMIVRQFLYEDDRVPSIEAAAAAVIAAPPVPIAAASR